MTGFVSVTCLAVDDLGKGLFAADQKDPDFHSTRKPAIHFCDPFSTDSTIEQWFFITLHTSLLSIEDECFIRKVELETLLRLHSIRSVVWDWSVSSKS
jgi:hypothetical protein